MRKPLVIAALLSALALGASACDVSALPYAAKVDGSTISTSSLNGVLDSVQSSATLRCYLHAQGVSYQGAGSGTYSSSFTAQRLSDLIKLKLYDGLFRKLNLTTTSYATTAATGILNSAFASSGCAQQGENVLPTLPSAYQHVLTSSVADELVLAAHEAGFSLTPSGFATYEQSQVADYTQMCFSVIIVSSESKASTLVNELQHGANFASIAKADSVDASTASQGGAFTPCEYPAYFTSPIDTLLASLPTGTVSNPVPLQGDYAIFLITSRGSPESAETTLQAVYGTTLTAATAAVSQYTRRVAVDVNPSYGAFTLAGNSGALVNPPKAPASSLLTNAAALSATTGG